MMPIFSSSPWMRGAPQRKFARAHLADQVASLDGDPERGTFYLARPQARGSWNDAA